PNAAQENPNRPGDVMRNRTSRPASPQKIGKSDAGPLPSLQPIPAEDKVRALLVADIHLSHRPPIARAAEPDWYAAMERQLFQLRYLSDHYRAPVICAGDVFDDGWRA